MITDDDDDDDDGRVIFVWCDDWKLDEEAWLATCRVCARQASLLLLSARARVGCRLYKPGARRSSHQSSSVHLQLPIVVVVVVWSGMSPAVCMFTHF